MRVIKSPNYIKMLMGGHLNILNINRTASLFAPSDCKMEAKLKRKTLYRLQCKIIKGIPLD